MRAYLKYDDIKGDVREPAHRTWITLTSVSYGTSRQSMSEIQVTKNVDSASVLLYQQALKGEPVSAVIDYVRGEGNGGVYLRIAMSGTLIASYQTSGSGGSATETLTLNFEKIEFASEPGTPPP